MRAANESAMGIVRRIRDMGNEIDTNLERQRAGIPAPREAMQKMARRWWVFLALAVLNILLLVVTVVLVQNGSWLWGWVAAVWGLQGVYQAFIAGFAFNNHLRQQGRLVGGFRNSFSVYEPSVGQPQDQ